VWPNLVVTDDSLVQCIKDLRKALKDDARSIIQTLPKRGYRLVPGGELSQAPAAAPPSAEFQQDIRFATTVDGARIAYATSGSGPPLVRAVHWMSHIDLDWRNAVGGPWIQGLSQRFRHVRYDARGCGLSDRGAGPKNLDDEVCDLEAVVDAAGLDRFALYARSQGGAIAVRYAARHPERVSHLVTIGGFVRGSLRRGELSPTADNQAAFWKLIEDGWGQDNAAFRQLMTSLIFPGANAEQMHAFNAIQRAACSPQVAAQLGRVHAEYDACADLPQVRCPALILHSPDDRPVPFEEGRMIASMIPGARLVPFASVNHVPLPTEPAFDIVNRLMDEFLLGAPSERGFEGQTTEVAATRETADAHPHLRVVRGAKSSRQ
jgi:pimeloyl-ACP methyl ester carboxylesterase